MGRLLASLFPTVVKCSLRMLGIREPSLTILLRLLKSFNADMAFKCFFRPRCPFFSETPRYEEQNLHSVFTSTKDYFYATVGKFGFFCLTKIFLILWPMANEKFWAQKRAQT